MIGGARVFQNEEFWVQVFWPGAQSVDALTGVIFN
jgi:hypothetical protein